MKSILKNIKPIEWAIGLGIAITTYIVVSRIKLKGINDLDSSLSKSDLEPLKDSNSEKEVQRLHPKFRNIARALINRTKNKLGLDMFVTSGLRTYAKQAELHKQNSQNARPGYSSHNFGFAFDVNVKDKKGNIILRKSSSSKQWKDAGVVKIANDLGLKWGGDGAFGSYHDPVHFYIKPNGKSTSELRALNDSGKKDSSGYVLV
jgi:hypothetical protein